MINLKIVARAMNEWNDVYRHVPEGVCLYVETWFQRRKRIRVFEDGNIKIGNVTIRPQDRPLIRDILDACDHSEEKPFVPMMLRSKEEQDRCKAYNPQQ